MVGGEARLVGGFVERERGVRGVGEGACVLPSFVFMFRVPFWVAGRKEGNIGGEEDAFPGFTRRE